MVLLLTYRLPWLCKALHVSSLMSCSYYVAGLKTGESSVLVSGADFYSNPRPSPDGTKLAWVRPKLSACRRLHAFRWMLLGEISCAHPL